MLRLITLTALFSGTQAAYDSTTPIVMMKDYSKDYRTLDCSECIQAQGKMCGKADGSSNIAVTGSSNQGHGTCCKPDNITDSHCQTKGDYICSQPVLAKDNAKEWAGIMTDGKNLQLTAYCPLIKPETCGITGTDHKIVVAAGDSKKISLTGATKIVAKKGTSKSGLYDACYWEFSGDKTVGADQSIHFKITKLSNVNVHLYGGASRAEATTLVVEENAALVAGKTYSAPALKGALLTALPVYNAAETSFEFEYIIDKSPPPPKTLVQSLAAKTEAAKGGSMPMIIGIVVGVVAVILIIVAVMKIRQNKNANAVQVLAQESLDEQPQNQADKTNNDEMNTIELKDDKKADAEK